MSRYSSNPVDPYCYPDTEILINKKEIRDQKKLDMYERVYSAKRLLEMAAEPIHGNFDLQHLMKIHYIIFKDIYPFAGEIRTVNINKGYMFCAAEYIESYFKEMITDKLRLEDYLIYCNFEEFCQRSAYYFGEVNAVHPAREGNGRAQREYFRLLALRNGYEIDWSRVNSKEMLDASLQSNTGSTEKLTILFKKAILNKQPNQQLINKYTRLSEN